eukprot:5660086-Amphidinium_carterae.2
MAMNHPAAMISDWETRGGQSYARGQTSIRAYVLQRPRVGKAGIVNRSHLSLFHVGITLCIACRQHALDTIPQVMPQLFIHGHRRVQLRQRATPSVVLNG